jgi:hypothetical protein
MKSWEIPGLRFYHGEPWNLFNTKANNRALERYSKVVEGVIRQYGNRSKISHGHFVTPSLCHFVTER